MSRSSLGRYISSELGASRQFWIERYNQFQGDRSRLAGSAPTEELSRWGQSFPVRALRELGWLPKGSRGERLSEDILSFFGCDSISGWNERYSAGIGQVAFRTSFAFETDEVATLAWLRIGEMQAENLTLAKFSASNFKKRLTELKRLCALTHVMRVNGVQVAAETPPGMMAALNAGLMIGARDGAGLFAGMRLYGLLLIDHMLAGTELARAERWAAKQCGAIMG